MPMSKPPSTGSHPRQRRLFERAVKRVFLDLGHYSEIRDELGKCAKARPISVFQVNACSLQRPLLCSVSLLC
jgi:hypothetical protein